MRLLLWLCDAYNETTRYPNLIAIFISSGYKNEARKVNTEVFKEKYLGTSVGTGDMKGNDSKVLCNYRKVTRYHEVGYYFLKYVNKGEGFVFLIVFQSIRTIKESIDKPVPLKDFFQIK